MLRAGRKAMKAMFRRTDRPTETPIEALRLKAKFEPAMLPTDLSTTREYGVAGNGSELRVVSQNLSRDFQNSRMLDEFFKDAPFGEQIPNPSLQFQ